MLDVCTQRYPDDKSMFEWLLARDDLKSPSRRCTHILLLSCLCIPRQPKLMAAACVQCVRLPCVNDKNFLLGQLGPKIRLGKPRYCHSPIRRTLPILSCVSSQMLFAVAHAYVDTKTFLINLLSQACMGLRSAVALLLMQHVLHLLVHCGRGRQGYAILSVATYDHTPRHPTLFPQARKRLSLDLETGKSFPGLTAGWHVSLSVYPEGEGILTYCTISFLSFFLFSAPPQDAATAARPLSKAWGCLFDCPQGPCGRWHGMHTCNVEATACSGRVDGRAGGSTACGSQPARTGKAIQEMLTG